MEEKHDDLNEENGLPQPGTEEPTGASEGEAGSGPGNVSVDEPTAGALDENSGSPGEEEEEEEEEEDNDDDEDTSTTGDESD